MLHSIRKHITGIAMVATLAAPGLSMAADPAEIRFAAAPTGSTWYAYAGAFRAAALEALPAGSVIEIMNTPMATANTKLLHGERADMGMIFPPVASWATQAFGPFDAKVDNVRGLVGGVDEYFQRITVQKDFPLESLADIKAKKIAVRIGTGPQGSLNEYIARLILAANDLTYEDIEKLGGSVTMNGFGVLRNEFGDEIAAGFEHRRDGPGVHEHGVHRRRRLDRIPDDVEFVCRGTLLVDLRLRGCRALGCCAPRRQRHPGGREVIDDPPSAGVGADACRELHGPVEPPQTQRDVERAPAHMLDGFGTAAVDDVDEGFSDDERVAVHSGSPGSSFRVARAPSLCRALSAQV